MESASEEKDNNKSNTNKSKKSRSGKEEIDLQSALFLQNANKIVSDLFIREPNIEEKHVICPKCELKIGRSCKFCTQCGNKNEKFHVAHEEEDVWEMEEKVKKELMKEIELLERRNKVILERINSLAAIKRIVNSLFLSFSQIYFFVLVQKHFSQLYKIHKRRIPELYFPHHR